MDTFLEKVKSINSIEEAIELLWSEISTSDNIQKALDLSLKAHEGQFRKSGEPYIVHPILVAAITARISHDEIMVQGALLHDVIEDTEYTADDLEKEFGSEISHLVEGLTKIVEIREVELTKSTSHEKLLQSALTFKKMLLASINDAKVLVIKLCDRTHNMLTLDALKAEKQKRIAEETLLVYVPIAHKLGISNIKNFLEDLCFFYIYPKEYEKIDNLVNSSSQSLQFKLNSFIDQINHLMETKCNFSPKDFNVIGRVKHHYSIHLKMQRKGITLEEVLDFLAVRVLVKEPIDCYKVLGVIHLEFKPLISRFKDYIGLPKENGYQTIHTTVFGKHGVMEVQVRTFEMHKLAEYGVAAHWKYKGNKDSVNLNWIKDISYKDGVPIEIYESAKDDLHSEDITVHSPKGDHYTLPKGSVALDFAYAIHTEIGANASGALINKQKASLLTTLKHSDLVSILKDEEPTFHCSWEESVKTSRAKEGIRNICRTRLKEINRKTGLNILATLFNQKQEIIKEMLEVLEIDEKLYKIPYKIEFFKEIIKRIAEYTGAKELRAWEVFKKGYKKPKEKTIEHFMFFLNSSLDGIEFDYCCHPKMDDKIVAFYSDGKAIIHHKLCKEASKKIDNNEKMIFVDWNHSKLYKYRLILSLQNQQGILANLLTKVSKMGLNVISIDLGIKNSEKAEHCNIEVETQENEISKIRDKISQMFNLIEITSLDDAYNNK